MYMETFEPDCYCGNVPRNGAGSVLLSSERSSCIDKVTD